MNITLYSASFYWRFFFSLFWLAVICTPLHAQTPHFSVIKTGKMPSYKYDNEHRQDISGIAYGGGVYIIGDDGGTNSQYPEVRVAGLKELMEPATILRRQVVQKDIEGATFKDNSFYLTASMSDVNEDTEAYRVLAEVTLDPVDKKVVSERYVYMRDPIIDALKLQFRDANWYGRVSTTFGKEGGLNVEGLSTSHLGNDYLTMGLRSPLWSPLFGSSKFGEQFALTKGEAILAHIKDPFGIKPNLELESINLKGNGIRSLEYIADLKGYLIVAGPVEKDSAAFGLWWYTPKQAPIELTINEFKTLCRPEAISVVPEHHTITIFSEESGQQCTHTPFTLIELGYE
jgi:hypothetical protein